MQLVSPMQYENGSMQLNVVNDGQVDTDVQSDLSFVTCFLSHKTSASSYLTILNIVQSVNPSKALV